MNQSDAEIGAKITASVLAIILSLLAILDRLKRKTPAPAVTSRRKRSPRPRKRRPFVGLGLIERKAERTIGNMKKLEQTPNVKKAIRQMERAVREIRRMTDDNDFFPV